MGDQIKQYIIEDVCNQ